MLATNVNSSIMFAINLSLYHENSVFLSSLDTSTPKSIDIDGKDLIKEDKNI